MPAGAIQDSASPLGKSSHNLTVNPIQKLTLPKNDEHLF